MAGNESNSRGTSRDEKSIVTTDRDPILDELRRSRRVLPFVVKQETKCTAFAAAIDTVLQQEYNLGCWWQVYTMTLVDFPIQVRLRFPSIFRIKPIKNSRNCTPLLFMQCCHD